MTNRYLEKVAQMCKEAEYDHQSKSYGHHLLHTVARDAGVGAGIIGALQAARFGYAG